MDLPHLLITSARARAMPLRALALETGETPDRVSQAMTQACTRALGTCPSSPDLTTTFDQLIAQAGRATAALGSDARSSYPMKPIYVMTPSVLAFAIDTMQRPELARAPWVRTWRRAARSGLTMSRANQAGVAPPPGMKPPGTPGVYQSAPDTQWTHVVVAGDTPADLAYWITGNGGLSGPGNYTELIDANPEKPTVGTRGSWSFNFKNLVVGEKIRLPKAWDQYISEAGDWGTKGVPYPVNPSPSLPTPPTPSSSSDDYSASLPAGRIAAIKTELGVWGKKTGTVTTYPGLFDLNDAIDEPFHGAVAQFQQWSNTNKGTSLRTDGRLDAATVKSLDDYVAGVASSAPMPTTPAPLPNPWLPSAVSTAPPIIPSAPLGSLPAIPGTPPPLPPSPFAGAGGSSSGSSSSSSDGGSALPLLVAVLAIGSQFVK